MHDNTKQPIVAEISNALSVSSEAESTADRRGHTYISKSSRYHPNVTGGGYSVGIYLKEARRHTVTWLEH